MNDNHLMWMHDLGLARNSRQKNLEIIYNDNKVYFKTVRPIYKHESLSAFPSKDLEISLGLQFIPAHSGKFGALELHILMLNRFFCIEEDKYTCKKCMHEFTYQYGLMLHSRYFCSRNTNKLLKTISFNTNYDLLKHAITRKRKHEVIEDDLMKRSNFDMSPLSDNMIYYQTYLRLLQQQQSNQFTNQLLTYFDRKNNTTDGSQSQTIRLSQPEDIEPSQPEIKTDATTTELNQVLTSQQALQNWCAKCNTYFRLTSDLVYHMRTFHRKENQITESSSSSAQFIKSQGFGLSKYHYIL